MKEVTPSWMSEAEVQRIDIFSREGGAHGGVCPPPGQLGATDRLIRGGVRRMITVLRRGSRGLV